jgi:hypothetical protein
MLSAACKIGDTHEKGVARAHVQLKRREILPPTTLNGYSIFICNGNFTPQISTLDGRKKLAQNLQHLLKQFYGLDLGASR